MATLGLKEMEKGNFPISFKPKVAIAEFFWKMQRKTWYSILGVDAMPLSLKNLLLNMLTSEDFFQQKTCHQNICQKK